MKSGLVDDFSNSSIWTAIASGQARLDLYRDDSRLGSALRLDFDFCGGGGFVVARRPFSLVLPESYCFRFGLRGIAPRNIFEFKLVDTTNQNVWRYREEALDFPKDRQAITIKSTQIGFAWGPLGGGPPRDIAAIELVIAAGPGGKGTVWIDDLRLEDTTYRLNPIVTASSTRAGYDPHDIFDPSMETSWQTEVGTSSARLEIDFQQLREYGGLVIHWQKDLRPQAVDLRLSKDGHTWETVLTVREGVGEQTCAFLPGAASRFVRLDLGRSSGGAGFGVIAVEVKPYEFSRSVNAFFEAIAKTAGRGHYPRYLVGEQTYWTPVGTGADVTQALFNEDGMVEVDKGSFSVEPFLYADGRLISWADAALEQRLEDSYLPIPSSAWRIGDLIMTTTAFACDCAGWSTLFIRYRLENLSSTSKPLTLFAALRPFQVTPTWQNWHGFGGVSTISALDFTAGHVRVNGTKEIMPLTPPVRSGASAFAQGDISEWLKTGDLPVQDHVNDEFGYASAALRYDLVLTPQDRQDLYLAIPFGPAKGADERSGPMQHLSGAEAFNTAVEQWRGKLNLVGFQLPATARAVTDTLKTATAHILINRDGPALQPGPRRYSRSWIRDGAVMGAALLRMGHSTAMRDFIRWYAGYQTADGNLPDCVDREGCEWLPEYDSWGQFIYAVMDYYRFSGDGDFLAEMWPQVLLCVDFMEALRRRRLTPEYKTEAKRACYGLLPESMSHEGYMAHPVHAYWDDFWALRGLKDAAAMAAVLGDSDQEKRLADLRESFCDTLYSSLNMTIRDRHLDFVPGSVEFADFDPAATAVAIAAIDELHHLPRLAVDQTFDKYMVGFRQRARGEVAWSNYSAYEIRIIGALVRLGRRQEAHELLDFFLGDRRIVPWNQWPEISWREPRGPSFIGDMPHSWISAEYILSVRSLFAYEREADDAVVLAAGLHQDWLSTADGVAVAGLPTEYGKLSYSLRREGAGTLRLAVSGTFTRTPGRIVVKPPLPGPLRHVEVNGREIAVVDQDEASFYECPADVILRC